MRSMDDVRFLPGKDDECTQVEITKTKRIQCKCSKCGEVSEYDVESIEDFIESEERDPDIEFLKCKECNGWNPITNGVVEVFDGVTWGKLYSDGYFVYMEIAGRKERLS